MYVTTFGETIERMVVMSKGEVITLISTIILMIICPVIGTGLRHGGNLGGELFIPFLPYITYVFYNTIKEFNKISEDI